MELSAADIARMRGWSRWKAWRWLRALEHEGEDVQRRGRAIFITTEALEVVAAKRRMPRKSNRVAALESEVAELRERVAKQERETAALRRQLGERRTA